MKDYVIKRGYVKWTDEDGVMHKEPLYEYPELLAKASTSEQIAAEEARRLNESAERAEPEAADEEETLEALKSAPDDVKTVADLEAVDLDGETLIVPESELPSALPSSEPLVRAPGKDAYAEELWSEDHDEALNQLNRVTSK